MQSFMKCSWCGQYTLLPSTDDFIEEVKANMKKEVGNRATETSIRAIAKVKSTLAVYKHNCSCCSEPLTGDFLDKNEYEERGYALYEEYKEFMGDVPLPDKIKIEAVESDRFYGAVRYDETTGLFNVFLNIDMCYSPYLIRSVLYHEFTHVMDLYDPITGGIIQDKNKIHWYSEYHASNIEMMALLEFKSIKQKKRITPSTKVIYKNKRINIIKYIECIIDTSIQSVKKQEIPDRMKFEGILLAIVYNLGRINCCKKHIAIEFYNHIPDLSKIYDYIKLTLRDDDYIDGFNSYTSIIDKILDDISDQKDDGVLDDIILKIWMLLDSNESDSEISAAAYKYIAFNKATGVFKNTPNNIIEKI